MHVAVSLPSYIPVERFCSTQFTADRNNDMGYVPLKEVKKANETVRSLRFIAKIGNTLLIRMTAQIHVIR